MFSREIFAKRVSSLRTANGMKQEELARAVGVTTATISRIESTDRAVSVELLCALADYFSASVDYLLGYIDENDHGPITLREEGPR